MRPAGRGALLGTAVAPVGVAGGEASLTPPESETSSVALPLPIRLPPLKLCQARVVQSTRGDKFGERARKCSKH